jgi:probable F420-dependent oxidoreductase
MARFAKTAEDSGFSGIAFTEHPAPSHKWMSNGGHDSFDPFAALAFCAASTTRIRLMTYLLILPYRNPLLAAKSAATVDVLSNGRLTLGVGTGYLRSEFAALGVDFDERNELFDEAIASMHGIWTTERFAMTGRHFTALSQTAKPPPVQKPNPPFWIGGNSRAALARVVRYGSGWTPLLNSAVGARTTRTPLMDTTAKFAAAVSELRELMDEAGRVPNAVDIQIETTDSSIPAAGSPTHRHLEKLAELAAAGANWYVVDPPVGELEQAFDAVRHYGEHVISSLSHESSTSQDA